MLRLAALPGMGLRTLPQPCRPGWPPLPDAGQQQRSRDPIPAAAPTFSCSCTTSSHSGSAFGAPVVPVLHQRAVTGWPHTRAIWRENSAPSEGPAAAERAAKMAGW